VAPLPAVADKPVRGQDDGAIKIVRSTPSDVVNPLVAGAYKSLASGDLAQAEKGYRQALQQNPRDRDALLGIAAIAAARHRPDEAAGYYLQVLELDPKDAAAQAGLIGVRGAADPVQGESQLKMLLAQHPDAGFLHFALGNLYAQQVRWGEAQSAYFNAFTADPGNADYAFNLAVSLDHLNQGKLALRYYQEALRLAGDRPTDFGKAQVLDRVRALSH
jgi:tetratricopeptide (TPR) repeat protein